MARPGPLLVAATVTVMALGAFQPDLRAQQRQELGVRIGQQGLDFAAETLPALLPAELAIPDIDQSLYSCAKGRDIVLHLRDGRVALEPGVISLRLYSGQIAGSLSLSLAGTGHVRVDNLDACQAPIECDVGVTVTDLHLETVLKGEAKGGQLELSAPTLEIKITPEQIDLDVTACPQGAMLTDFLDAAKRLLLDHATTLVEDFARQTLPPLVAAKVGELARLDGALLGFDYAVGLDQATLAPEGLDLLLGVSVGYSGPTAACNGLDVTPPPPVEPQPLRLDLAPQSAFVMGLSTGLVQQALDAVWQSGLLCIDAARLALLGIDLGALDLAGSIPGLAPGTTFDLSVSADHPPTLVTEAVSSGSQVKLGLRLEGLSARLELIPPAGERTRIDLEADGTVTGLLDLDASAGNLGLTLADLALDRLVLSSPSGASLSIDQGRLEQILRDLVLPLVASKLGRVPLTAASLDLAGFAISVDQVMSRPEGVYAGISVLRPPTDDSVPPLLTGFQTPAALVRAGIVAIDVAAEDDQTPPSFARFSYRLDGDAESEPSYSRQIRLMVTEAGPHSVEVWAHDLNGNRSTSRSYDFEVDAQPPLVSFTTQPPALVNQPVATLAFTGTDDRTGPAALAYAVDVYASLPGQARQLQAHQDFGPAAEVALDALQNGGVYEVVVTARDEAGNTSTTQTSFAVQLGGGCSTVPGTTAGPAAPWLLLALGGLLTRRRREARCRA